MSETHRETKGGGNSLLKSLLFFLVGAIFIIATFAKINEKELVEKVRGNPEWCFNFCERLGYDQSIFFDGAGCKCLSLCSINNAHNRTIVEIKKNETT